MAGSMGGLNERSNREGREYLARSLQMTAVTPRFPTIELALGIHAEMLSQYGGLDGIRDYAKLEAAIAAPQMTMGGDFLNPTLPKMAAALLVSLCQGHPFLDGNKRTATVLVQLLGGEWSDT